MRGVAARAGGERAVRDRAAAPVAAAARCAEPRRRDRAAEAYAVLFARRYLTWNAAEPQASAQALEPFLGPGMEADAGLRAAGERRAAGGMGGSGAGARTGAGRARVHGRRADGRGGLLYLTVAVVATADGSARAGRLSRRSSGRPPRRPRSRARGICAKSTEPALATVVQRALRNYLAASAERAGGGSRRRRARLAPGLALSLESMQRLDWAPEGGAVLATVQAQDGAGSSYTLAYELDVVREQGRWEISAVQMDPDA